MESPEISQRMFYLRDINPAITKAWQEEFGPYRNTVKVCACLTIQLKLTCTYFLIQTRLNATEEPSKRLEL